MFDAELEVGVPSVEGHRPTFPDEERHERLDHLNAIHQSAKPSEGLVDARSPMADDDPSLSSTIAVATSRQRKLQGEIGAIDGSSGGINASQSDLTADANGQRQDSTVEGMCDT